MVWRPKHEAHAVEAAQVLASVAPLAFVLVPDLSDRNRVAAVVQATHMGGDFAQVGNARLEVEANHIEFGLTFLPAHRWPDTVFYEVAAQFVLQVGPDHVFAHVFGH